MAAAMDKDSIITTAPPTSKIVSYLNLVVAVPSAMHAVTGILDTPTRPQIVIKVKYQQKTVCSNAASP